MKYKDNHKIIINEMRVQSQSMDLYFIIEVFKSILEFSLFLGCLYGLLMLWVEIH